MTLLRKYKFVTLLVKPQSLERRTMDFYKIIETPNKKGVISIYPDFRVLRSKDLMVRGRSFFAIWDEDRQLWSTDEFDVQRLVDKELSDYADFLLARDPHAKVHVHKMSSFGSNSWKQFRSYLNNLSDNAHQLDENLTFSNTEYTKKDFVSKKLSYPIEDGSTESWDIFMSTVFDPEEREKVEWTIGALVAGEAKNIQKFLVLYGEPGSGKSTLLNIIQKMFDGYYTTFESKALGSSNSAFATEAFKGNPLVAIEHDGDLSRIEDNTRLNSMISHEEMSRNEKNKPLYTARSNAFIIMGTNKPVKISDGKSGLLRRLIDVRTSGRNLGIHQFQTVLSRVNFELGAIAYRCLNVFRTLGGERYIGYKPTRMQYETDIFFNFVEENFYLFKQQDGVTLSQAWDLYKKFCDETSIEYMLPRHKFREELKNYFKSFKDVGRTSEGRQIRSIFSGFITDKFSSLVIQKEEPLSLVLDSDESLLDKEYADCAAQYASNSGFPAKKWSEVKTKLSDLDTSKLHYVVLPENRIYIDFDLKDESGEKSETLNREAASKWPATYAEYSKSGKGIHLHYIYDGDVTKLTNLYSEGIEVKRTVHGDVGPSTLRRAFTKSNNVPIAHINSGLPLKGEKVIDAKTVSSEKGLRELIFRNLQKEIHPDTKPSVDFIYKILEDAYVSGMTYDLTTLRPKVLAFANNSTNQSEYCIKLVAKMKFKSEDKEPEEAKEEKEVKDDSPLVFYDVEVFPNLLIVVWKYQGTDQKCVRMINPKPSEIEALFSKKLIGFNCRRYDNHILYGAYLGYNNEEIFDLSMKIVSNNSQNGYFREAYNISYTDIYDFSSVKKGLKAFQIDLGIHHQELGQPWDKPLPEELWIKAAEYCENDVISEELVFEDRKADFLAREILAELSGLTVNDTTQQHTARIIFGSDPKPQEQFIYTDLTEMFPGYKFDSGKSTYRGEEVGEGGYVYSEPGIYDNVALLDVASMHPASIENLNLFGKYTKKFSELKETRIAIKHKDFSKIKSGTFAAGIVDKYKGNPELMDALAYALKIAINIVYGLTSASFPNKFRDQRNIDNIVAKRGALFMIDLQKAVQEKGYTVAHIKTDSIKIPNATSEIISFVFEFGKKYGYDFEHEATFSKFCLVNDAVYIAKYKDGKKTGQWSATGAQFAHPFVFKSLFSKEEIVFSDLCESKSVTGNSSLYLDMEDFLKEGDQKHNYVFVGKVGLFCPVRPGSGGGLLMREKEGKYYAATGTKGYRWLEAEVVKNMGLSDQIDTSYYEALLEDAIKHISEFGDFEKFVSE